jgi:hypothetical protein
MVEERTVYEVWSGEADQEVIDAGYTFVSDGTWYAKGTEAVLLFNISGGNNGADPVLQTVEDYVESVDSNYSGLFGGSRDVEGDWDEEGCGYDEFDIYKNGILVRKATRAKSIGD